MGAAGRDFHNFNVFFKDKPDFKIVAFTATQIPFIENRVYPPTLAGSLYPDGIPIFGEELLPELIRKYRVDDVFFSYSDVSHRYVMHIASLVLANGASFHLLGPKDTMLKASKPVIAVVASRTGAGKSTISRRIVSILKNKGLKPVVVRHPMPYGDLSIPVQRFEKFEDLDEYGTTIEEREEYEGHMEMGVVVYAGIDYSMILSEAEKECDVIVWDGGNNDISFYKPDLNIVVLDPMRPGDEMRYHPGESNLRMADVIVVNKVNIADPVNVEKLVQTSQKTRPGSPVFRIESRAVLDKPELVSGKKTLVIEDGPSVTHGGLREGAGAMAVRNAGGTMINPREFAVGSIKAAYEKFPNIGDVLPALGYSPSQLMELEQTVRSVQCDAIVLGTPADLSRLIRIQQPVAKVRFEALDLDKPGFSEYIASRVDELVKR